MSEWKASNILASGEAIEYGSSLIGVHERVLPTGLETWDTACDDTGGRGIATGRYVVVGGASNSGKTRLALHLLRQAAEAGLPPGLITMEVPKAGIQRQIYSNVTSFGYYDLLPHRFDRGTSEDVMAKVDRLTEEVTAYARAGGNGGRSLIVAEQERPPTLADIMRACGQLYDAGCRVLFLDHLQLIKASADQISDRATEISEALRWFAHGKGCLVVALSQLNRMASRERQRRPTMHDLLGGTSIEANANQVVLIDHSQQRRDPVHPHLLRTWLYLDKNREGPSRLLFPVEINFRTGVWREALADELSAWPGGDR